MKQPLKRSARCVEGNRMSPCCSPAVTTDTCSYTCSVCRYPHSFYRTIWFLTWRRNRSSKLLYPAPDGIAIRKICVSPSSKFVFCYYNIFFLTAGFSTSSGDRTLIHLFPAEGFGAFTLILSPYLPEHYE